MKLGFLGLGRMGSGMVEKLLKGGHEIVVWNRSPEPVEQLLERLKAYSSSEVSPKGGRVEKFSISSNSIKIAKSIQELVQSLATPRIIWSMLPSGEVTESTLKEIAKYTSAQDIIIDGSNAYYKDTQRRSEELTARGLRFLGIGVAGGIIGPKEGYDMMAGGSKSAYKHIIPILEAIAKPHATHGYFGEGGAGHFVKMVHNGVEYGIMQSLSEGFDVLEHAPYKLDLLQVGNVWQKSSLVSGFMLDRAVEVLEADPHLERISGKIDSTGEGEWTIKQARQEGVDVPSIELALEYRKKSQTDTKIQQSFTAKMVAALRNAFGGHKVEKKI